MTNYPAIPNSFINPLLDYGPDPWAICHDGYAPGHNCFFQTSNGDDWLLYHANPRPGLGCENERSPADGLVRPGV